MRFSALTALSLLGAVVEALPVESSKNAVWQADSQNVKPTIRDTKSLVSRQSGDEDTTQTKAGNDVVTVSKSQGTTDDKIGYSWRPAGLGDSLSKRQADSEDTTEVKDGNTVITVSKSQGTTDDKKGYSWRQANLGE